MNPNDGTPHHDLESRLRRHLEMSAGPVRTPDLDLDRIRRRGRHRRNVVRSAVASTSIVALVAVGLVALRVTGGDGDEGFTVDGGTPVTESSPDATAPTVAPGTDAGSDGAPAATAPPGGPLDFAGSARSVMVTDQGSRVVRWGDDYLRVATEWEQPAIGPLPDDVADLFPAEVVEFFADVASTDGAAALDALTERPDLLAEVERVVADHPDTHDVVFGTPGKATLLFDASADGIEWTRRGELDLPDGVDYVSHLAADGDRVVVVGSSWGSADAEFVSRIVVASTADLRSWDSVQELQPLEAIPLPDGFWRDTSVSGVAVGPSGVAIVLTESSHFDIDELVPDDVRDELWQSPGGYVTSSDDGGVTIEVIDEPREVTAPGPDGTEIIGYEEGEVVATYSFTWDELGVDADIAMSPPMGATLWSGDVVAGLVASDISDLVADPGSLVGVASLDGAVALAVTTSTGPAIWYSTDGVSWSERTPAVGEHDHGQHLERTRGGLLLVVDAPTATQVWVSDATAENWQRGADLPTLDPTGGGSAGRITLGDGDSTGFAAVLTIDGSTGMNVDGPDEIVLERDGYRLTARVAGRSSVDDVPAFSELVRVRADGADEVVFVWDGSVDPDAHVTTGADGSVTVLDPTTGDPLVTFTNDDVDAAYAEVRSAEPAELSSEPWRPTFVVVVTDDGRTWRVLDVIAPAPDDGTQGTDGADDGPVAPLDGRWPSALVIAPDEVLLGLTGGEDTVEYRIYDR